jgi:hypothetical protein
MENLNLKNEPNIYTLLSVAKEEIWKRWDNVELKKKVQEVFGEIPEIFQDKPRAIFFRNIATPNLELSLALEQAKVMGLDLLVLEYTIDKFCTRNKDKLHLGKMMFFKNDNKLQIVGKENVIAIKEMDSKCFNEVKTLWGEDFVSFHHRLLKSCGYENVKTFDASKFKELNDGPHEMYMKVLSLCASSAVLLENFLFKFSVAERKFVDEIIVPTFNEVSNNLGLRPLIVPLANMDGEDSEQWQYYPESTKKFIASESV